MDGFTKPDPVFVSKVLYAPLLMTIDRCSTAEKIIAYAVLADFPWVNSLLSKKVLHERGTYPARCRLASL